MHDKHCFRRLDCSILLDDGICDVAMRSAGMLLTEIIAMQIKFCPIGRETLRTGRQSTISTLALGSNRVAAALQVKYWTESGASGFRVYLYQMRRRPGQGELYSKALVFGGGSAPKQHNAASRRKEARPPHAYSRLHALPWKCMKVRGKDRAQGSIGGSIGQAEMTRGHTSYLHKWVSCRFTYVCLLHPAGPDSVQQ